MGKEATVFDVAKYILHKEGPLSTWKLQKLCYYAQAWQLAWTGEPLFNEDFEAWANGPVCRELFFQHQGKFTISEQLLPKGDESALNDDQKDSIDIILRDYGDMQPWELRELTHHEEPWKTIRGDLPEGALSSKVIPKDLIAEYYGGL